MPRPPEAYSAWLPVKQGLSSYEISSKYLSDLNQRRHIPQPQWITPHSSPLSYSGLKSLVCLLPFAVCADSLLERLEPCGQKLLLLLAQRREMGGLFIHLASFLEILSPRVKISQQEISIDERRPPGNDIF
jgi:hypothetical protein